MVIKGPARRTIPLRCFHIGPEPFPILRSGWLSLLLDVHRTEYRKLRDDLALGIWTSTQGGIMMDNDMWFLSANIAYSECQNREKQREETSEILYRAGLRAIHELRRENRKSREALSAT